MAQTGRFELYSIAVQVARALVLRTMLGDAEPPQSNRRRLADKQACRLGLLGYLCRRLPWQTTAQVQIAASQAKK
ncbi:MAG: hypothetical protein IKA46_02210 [Clostridia bacterium]|nr:hypothetical protein [Clostridia bacterium]